jgi:hypothetical protein
MSFLLPWGLLGLTITVPIVTLYFLKLKREEQVVPSTLLWKKVIEDLHVNAPFQRLRYSLLLILQLLLAIILALALARPFLEYAGFRSTSLVLLIDTSASMGTKDAGPQGKRTRLTQAILDAQEKIDAMSRTAEMRLLAFDRQVRQLTGWTGDKVLLKRALSELTPRDFGTDAQEALKTAIDLAAEREGSQILLLSDGAFGQLNLQALFRREGELTNLEDVKVDDLADRLQFVAYGKQETDNVGLTRVSTLTRSYREPGQTEETLETRLFLLVENFSQDETDVILTLTAEGARQSTKVIHLKGRPLPGSAMTAAEYAEHTEGARSEEVFALPGTTGVVNARIGRADGVVDAFQLDNEVQLVIGDSAGTHVLLVTAGNYFLQKALIALREAKISKQSPADFLAAWTANGAASVEEFDMVIFDGVAPPKWQNGGALFLNVMPPVEGFQSVGDPLEWPKTRVIDWKEEHPVLRYIAFGNVAVRKAQPWSIPKTTQALVDAEDLPLVVAESNDRFRVIGVAFDLYESTWAYRPSLPMFLRNSVLWASEVSPRRRPSALKTGEPIPIPPIAGVKEGTLVRPQGAALKIPLSADHKTFVEATHYVGLYTLTGVTAGGTNKNLSWAVNLADENESDNATRRALNVGDKAITEKPQAIAAKREIWHWLALAVIVVLMVEGLVYHRRLGL